MTRIVVAWDIDDVLYGWYEKAHWACVKARLGLAHMVSPKTWHPYEEYGASVDQWYTVLAEAWEEIHRHRPYEEALYAFDDLDEAGAEQHFITSRGFMAGSGEIRAMTERWVETYFPDVASLTFSQSKGDDARRLGITHAIDDRHHNYVAFEAAGAKTYLMNQPWNQDATDVRRVHDLAEFTQAVLEGDTA